MEYVGSNPTESIIAFIPIDDAMKIKEQNDDTVVFEIKGETPPPTQMGDEVYHNVETLEIEVSREHAESIAGKILEESD